MQILQRKVLHMSRAAAHLARWGRCLHQRAAELGQSRVSRAAPSPTAPSPTAPSHPPASAPLTAASASPQAGTPLQLPGLGVGSAAGFSIFPNPKRALSSIFIYYYFFFKKRKKQDLTISILRPSLDGSEPPWLHRAPFVRGAERSDDAVGSRSAPCPASNSSNLN